MNKINQVFSNRGDRKLLSLYFCAGTPTLEGTGEVTYTNKEALFPELAPENAKPEVKVPSAEERTQLEARENP